MKSAARKKSASKRLTNKKSKLGKVKTSSSSADLPADFGLPHKSDIRFMLLETIDKLLLQVAQLIGVNPFVRQKNRKKIHKNP